MARPLRILIEGGWYHVISRGNRREALFLDDEDRRGFMGRVAELTERFGVEIHAFVLMNNHFHLLVRTRQANLSDAIHWLNVSYSTRFNWAHQRSGHVFQGRFNAVILQSTKEVSEVARYVHLNPVRITGLGLGKEDLRRAKVLGCADPGAALVNRRLDLLQEFRWSSWRVYSGKEPPPPWLETGTVFFACGGERLSQARKALTEFTLAPVRQGRLESPWERLQGGLVLGDADYAQSLLERCRTCTDEQTQARRLGRLRGKAWLEIVTATERVCGKPWVDLSAEHGDWGRDGAMYVAVRFGGMRLTEVLRELPGLKYQAGAQGVRRFQKSLEHDPKRREFVEALKRQLSII